MIQLEEDEVVVLEVRRHWFIFVLESFFVILMAIIPLFLAPVGRLLFSSVFGDLAIGQLGDLWLWLFVYSGWLLILWIIMFVIWTNYYLDVWIVTNKKVCDINQIGLFRREVSVLQLDKIQDINFEVKGVVATFLNIGNIEIQTAAPDIHFQINGVHDPVSKHFVMNQVLSDFRTTALHRI